VESQGALRLIESDDIGGKYSDEDGLIFHAICFFKDPRDIVVKGANLF